MLFSSALLALTGCAPSATDVTLYVYDDPVTKAMVTFETAEPARAYVEYGPTTDYGLRTPLGARGTEHQLDVLGLRGDTTYHYRVVVEGDDLPGQDGTFTTWPLPDTLLPLEVTGDSDVANGYTLFSTQNEDPLRSAVLIVDPEGQIVWYHEDDGMVLSARPSRDGRSVIVQVSRPSEDGSADASTIERVPLDGGAPTVFDVPFAHHDFIERDDGSIVSIVSRLSFIDGETIVGDALVRLSPDGELTDLWDAFTSLPLVENDGWESEPIDWTHANGLDWDPGHDVYALSLFRQHQVLILGSDGTVQSVIGEDGDFAFEDDPGFGPQHSPRFTDEGLQVFDNAGDGVSRVVEYTLDPDAGTAAPAWSLSSPWGEQVLVMGDGLRLDDGTTLSTWGDTGEILTTSPEGQVERSLVIHSGVGRVAALESVYPAE